MDLLQEVRQLAVRPADRTGDSTGADLDVEQHVPTLDDVDRFLERHLP